MGEQDHLTIGEWNRWREDDRVWKNGVGEKLDEISTSQAAITTEVAVIKAKSSAAIKKSGAISAVISAITGALAGAFK